jgi:lysyl-tRNA synthetase class 2
MASNKSDDDFAPTASWANLQLRAELMRRLRDFFDRRGFLEVETPLLSHDTVVDRHLDPLPVKIFDDPRAPHVGRTMWLQTSPEFAMKRLMATGADAIYQATRSFRAGERGRLHNVEFTIVEWYRRGDSMQAGIELLSELADHLLGLGPAEPISYREAFVQHVGIDPLTAEVLALARAARDGGLSLPDGIPETDRDAWLDLLLVGCVEPHLGCGPPTILYDYPATQAALAVVRNENPPVAERFELYVRGMELANGYHELTDPEVLRNRIATNNRQRGSDGKYQLPESNRLITALEHGLPACTGVALGFDRLVMVAAGAESLAEVMAFPEERA